MKRRTDISLTPQKAAKLTTSVSSDALRKLVGSWGEDYEIDAPTLSSDDAVVRGEVNDYKCHSGLRIHATDTLELHDLASKVDTDAGITIGLFLEGQLLVDIDGRWLELGRVNRPSGHLWSITQPSTIRRKSRRGMRVRKVLFTLPHDWIGLAIEPGATDTGKLERFLATHRATHQWNPSKRSLALAEQILNPVAGPNVLQSMAVESKAIEIITEAVSSLMGLAHSHASTANTVKASSRAQRIRDHVRTNLDGNLSLEVLANDLGMSVGSMQRAFKSAYDQTIVDFIREMRLHRAREALDNDNVSVSEAGYLAGYSSPANFSTAFKKLFGMTPSQARG